MHKYKLQNSNSLKKLGFKEDVSNQQDAKDTVGHDILFSFLYSVLNLWPCMI